MGGIQTATLVILVEKKSVVAMAFCAAITKEIRFSNVTTLIEL